MAKKKVMGRDQIIAMRAAEYEPVRVLRPADWEPNQDDLDAFATYKTAQGLIDFGEFPALKRLYYGKYIKAEEILKCRWPYRIMTDEWAGFIGIVETLKESDLEYIDN